jgi:trigger factor
VVVERLPKSQVEMTIDVPAETVDAAFERVLNRLTSKAKIEGFRPGKAPRAMVESRLGPAAIREEVVDVLVPEAVNQALKDQSIKPIDNPNVKIVELERGKAAKLTATVSVMPEVTLADPKKLSVEAPKLEVTDEMLERRLAELRDRLAEITPVEREVRTGDVVVMDIEVKVDDKVVESESRQATEGEVREGVLLPELLAILPGAQVDEQRTTSVKFPDDHSNPELAGKEATIALTVRGVKEKKVPELDDDVAKQLSDGKQETAEAYRAAQRTELEEQARAMEKLAHEQAVVKALVDGSEVEIPTALEDHELTSELEALERRLNRQGLRLDRYFAYLGKTIDQWVEDARPEANARLKVELVLDAFAKGEGLEPSDDDVTSFLAEQAATDDELKDHVDELKGSASARQYFGSRLRRRRVLERLMEVAGAAKV